MPNSVPYLIKPIVLSTVLVLLVSILLSGVLPGSGDLANKNFKKELAGNLTKDAGTEQENAEENGFSEEIVSMFYENYPPAKSGKLSDFFTAADYIFIVSQVSLDIPVPPPKNHAV